MSGPKPSGADREQGIAPAVQVLLVNCEPALAGLISEWLRPQGFDVQTGFSNEGREPCGSSHRTTDIPADIPADITRAARASALILAELAYPRRCGVDSLKRALGASGATTPIIVLSSMFFATVECCGPLARRLGVAGVLPTPTTREALLALVARLIGRTPPPHPHAAT